MKKNKLIATFVTVVSVFAILSFASCGKTKEEIIVDITPEMSAKVGGVAWTTKVAAGVNSTLYVITGTKEKEVIALTIPTKAIGVYQIDGINYAATYVADYDSISNGYVAYSGTIDIKSMNTLRTQVNGTFEFTAINADSNTISITNGFLKNIPTK